MAACQEGKAGNAIRRTIRVYSAEQLGKLCFVSRKTGRREISVNVAM